MVQIFASMEGKKVFFPEIELQLGLEYRRPISWVKMSWVIIMWMCLIAAVDSICNEANLVQGHGSSLTIEHPFLI